jgi:hypothetical protein
VLDKFTSNLVAPGWVQAKAVSWVRSPIMSFCFSSLACYANMTCNYLAITIGTLVDQVVEGDRIILHGGPLTEKCEH